MKKIIFGLILASSFLLSNDQWKKELFIHGGVLNNDLSKETSKYFCEHPNKELLEKEILEFFKNQDPGFYERHKDLTDRLPMKLIKSSEADGHGCPEDFEATGSCGNWKCSRIHKTEQNKR